MFTSVIVGIKRIHLCRIDISDRDKRIFVQLGSWFCLVNLHHVADAHGRGVLSDGLVVDLAGNGQQVGPGLHALALEEYAHVRLPIAPGDRGLSEQRELLAREKRIVGFMFRIVRIRELLVHGQ